MILMKSHITVQDSNTSRITGKAPTDEWTNIHMKILITSLMKVLKCETFELIRISFMCLFFK